MTRVDSRWTARRTGLALAVLCAAGAFVVALRARALAAADVTLVAERAALENTSRDLGELRELAAQREVVADAKRPTTDVIALVNAVLRDAGLPTTRLKALEPEADVPLAGRYRRQALRLAIERLSVPELGAFLAAWRAAASVWTPRSIELAHVASQDGSDLGFDVRIVIAATYLGDAASSTAPESSR